MNLAKRLLFLAFLAVSMQLILGGGSIGSVDSDGNMLVVTPSQTVKLERRQTRIVTSDDELDTPVITATRKVNPGGIDFSDVDVGYLDIRTSAEERREKKKQRNKRLQYVYKAGIADGEQAALEFAGDSKFMEDAFSVFANLPDNVFWVNLNPGEQDHIINSDFGDTESGKVLLDADLAMKKDVGLLVHPDSELGAEFWGDFYSHENALGRMLCFSFRTWIVPGEITVVSFQDAVYILEANLDVKMESEYHRIKGEEFDETGECPDEADPALQVYAKELYLDQILPALVDRVNTHESYSDLRNMFYARVLADWYKDNADDLKIPIGNFNIISWDPSKVHDEYINSLNKGEFKLRRAVEVDDKRHMRNFWYGGIDFTKVKANHVDASSIEADLAFELRKALDSGSVSFDQIMELRSR